MASTWDAFSDAAFYKYILICMFLALRGTMCYRDYHILLITAATVSVHSYPPPEPHNTQHSGRKPPTVTLLDRSCTSTLVFSDSIRRHHSMLKW